MAIENGFLREVIDFDYKDFETELNTIAQWWIEQAFDQHEQCFLGEISHDGIRYPLSSRGIILYTRILWFFSECALYQNNPSYKKVAEQVYEFLMNHFIDEEFGGVFWEVSAQGELINDRKQIYAQAFAIYAFSAYYKLSKNRQALEYAYGIFQIIEKYGRDLEKGGYFEAFSRQWSSLDDIRLSSKDLNSPKTMNTHLHILEAYTTLYSVEKNDEVGCSLKNLLGCYEQHFINPGNSHLRMFLDENWQDQSQAYSYGHDIESSWLIWEAVELLGDVELSKKFRPIVLKLVDVCLDEGLDEDGSVLDLFDFATNKRVKERVWWVQSEAMVGLMNAYQLSGDKKYLDAIAPIWDFINEEIKDHQHGEWHWLAKCDQKKDYKTYKVGFWKGPYHNGRAMIELCRRAENSL